MYHFDDVTSMAGIMMFVVLSLMGFMNRPRDSASIAFATFAGVLALDGLVTFLMNQATTLVTFRRIMHLAFVVGTLVPASAFFHVLACSGFLSRMQVRVLGIQVRTHVIFISALLVVVGVLFHCVFLIDIVQQHGGEISVKSAPAEGATFTVRLPAGVT